MYSHSSYCGSFALALPLHLEFCFSVTVICLTISYLTFKAIESILFSGNLYLIIIISVFLRLGPAAKMENKTPESIHWLWWG